MARSVGNRREASATGQGSAGPAPPVAGEDPRLDRLVERPQPVGFVVERRPDRLRDGRSNGSSVDPGPRPVRLDPPQPGDAPVDQERRQDVAVTRDDGRCDRRPAGRGSGRRGRGARRPTSAGSAAAPACPPAGRGASARSSRVRPASSRRSTRSGRRAITGRSRAVDDVRPGAQVADRSPARTPRGTDGRDARATASSSANGRPPSQAAAATYAGRRANDQATSDGARMKAPSRRSRHQTSTEVRPSAAASAARARRASRRCRGARSRRPSRRRPANRRRRPRRCGTGRGRPAPRSVTRIAGWSRR